MLRTGGSLHPRIANVLCFAAGLLVAVLMVPRSGPVLERIGFGTSSAGFYVRPDVNEFQRLGLKHDTDKVQRHNYQTIYGKLFELPPGRNRTRKMLEIGLGCNMEYGPGHSARVWREYMPDAEIWFGEYDAACVAKHRAHLDKLGVKAVTGDQADIATLNRWVKETGGGFDVIVDDGGHSNMQIYNSFIVLFEKALNPGGIFVIEDLYVCRTPSFMDGDGKHITLEVIKDWLDDLTTSHAGSNEVRGPPPRWPRPAGIKTIECGAHWCSITKCYANDPYC